MGLLNLNKLLCGISFSLGFVANFDSVAQQIHYHYNGKQIQLFQDSTTIMLYFDSLYAYKNDSNTFAGDASILAMNVSDGTEDIEFATISYHNKVIDIAGKIASYGINIQTELESYGYGYGTANGEKIWAFHEVLFRILPVNKSAGTNPVDTILTLYNAQFVELDDYDNYTYKVQTPEDAFSLANALVNSGEVVYAEPNMLMDFQLFQDPLYQEQYYLNNTGQAIDGIAGTPDIDIDAPEAWGVTTGSNNIKVAVIDDGVDIKNKEHEDMNVEPGFTPGCVTRCEGRPRKTGKHGEACAGIIAGNHNHIGVRGIAPDVKIIPFRIFKKNGSAKPSKKIAKAINKAWDDFDCDVLSNSWGGGAPANIITNAINNAQASGRGGLGSIVVFAAGNCQGCCNNINVMYPANLANTIAVGGVNLNGNVVGYTAIGPEIDVVAPTGDCGAGNIRTTDRMGKRGYTTGNYTSGFSGTSAACPQVSGIAALLLSVDPDLTEAEVRCRIREGARDIGALGFDNNTGFGIANAYYTIAITDMVVEDEAVTGEDAFVAANNITIGQNTTFNNGSNVDIIAGNRIVVTSGSSAQLGSFMHARIQTTGPCGAGSNGAGPFKKGSDTKTGNKIKQKSQQENLAISIYPNPTTNQFTVHIPGNESPATLTVKDLTGRTVRETATSGSYSVIDLTGCSKGLYFIKIIQNNLVFVEKIVYQ